MRVLLDECVTRYLKRDFTGHEVFTVEEAGFKGLKNGRLLQAASGHYDALVTLARRHARPCVPARVDVLYLSLISSMPEQRRLLRDRPPRDFSN